MSTRSLARPLAGSSVGGRKEVRWSRDRRPRRSLFLGSELLGTRRFETPSRDRLPETSGIPEPRNRYQPTNNRHPPGGTKLFNCHRVQLAPQTPVSSDDHHYC